MKNYRPIALSNTLNKLFIKILTNRLEKGGRSKPDHRRMNSKALEQTGHVQQQS